jgi:hypothetical protein
MTDNTANNAADELTSGAKVAKGTGKATKGATSKAPAKKAAAKSAPKAKADKGAANEKATLKNGTNVKNLPANSKAGKGSKAPAKAAADKKPKQRKATPEANRQSYAGRKITVLVKPADAGFREGSGRFARFAIVAKAKNTDDVLGKEATDANGNVSTIGGNHLAFFVANEFIRLD